MIDACPSRDSVAGATHLYERSAGLERRVCVFCGAFEPKESRESTWWHCAGCGQTRFTHKPPEPCVVCPGSHWIAGKGKGEPRNDQGMRELCEKCKAHNIPRHAVGSRSGQWLCQEHYDQVPPWQLHDCDGNLLGEFWDVEGVSQYISDRLKFNTEEHILEDVLKYRFKNTNKVTIEKGLLTCPLCGGHEFILVEGGYDRIDRTTFDPVNGKLILANFQGFSEGGDGETMLSCVSDGCVADSRFPIPEGVEVDYD